jgi:hypothetical protein
MLVVLAETGWWLPPGRLASGPKRSARLGYRVRTGNPDESDLRDVRYTSETVQGVIDIPKT